MASAGRMVGLARQFSTSAVQRSALVRPPLAVFGVDGRYATALYSAASKEKKLDAIEKELLKFKGQLEQDKKLAEFIDNPLVQKLAKRDALTQALTKLNYSKIMVNFIGALAEHGRIRQVATVINTFSRIMGAVRGEVHCEITSAKPLDAATEKELEGALKAFLKKGEVIILTKKVDPSIIGGLIVSIGDKYVDMSIASKVKTFTDVIKQAV
ncbi:ATP synthase subunit O, mitochondrial-like [Ornithodoros turicata]|uniref:Oligomycin sensitivity conferral protein n=1 Tax=Ornithodoros turicata TaxID=34597 RepID=A0A2R5LMZ3_9ACAR